ncbi:uncharacterized protein LOC131929782 [Physella acuta]|uniref:uncharacterized protein LOC131929782 n=1 Tax=Physella acuta TaxID=109671 RepID=UPI0027DC1988|nr:uncharacterized protein LOC131929782 [Physella acuta]
MQVKAVKVKCEEQHMWMAGLFTYVCVCVYVFSPGRTRYKNATDGGSKTEEPLKNSARRRKKGGEHLIEETQRLECHNTTLRSEIKQLHEEREQLTRIIRSHASVCPLTPRQSPLTVIRESPLPIRESPLTLPLSSASLLARSPVMGKSPVVVQSPVLLVPPTRESPVPLLIINPTRESPIPARVIPSSPIPMSSRPRKSPVSMLRVNPSPILGERLGDKSPIPFGSPPKQSKHSIPPRLNLAGPKPVVPILPKPAAHSSPSPKTPLSMITSPLPTAPSPQQQRRLHRKQRLQQQPSRNHPPSGN